MRSGLRAKTIEKSSPVIKNGTADARYSAVKRQTFGQLRLSETEVCSTISSAAKMKHAFAAHAALPIPADVRPLLSGRKA